MTALPQTHRRDVRGVTLIELVVTIALVGILSAVTVARVTTTSARSVANQADRMRRDLAHVQMLAMTWGVALGFNATTTGYYVTCRSTRTGTPCTTLNATPTDPATGDPFSVTLTDSVTIGRASSVDFDSMGRPMSGTTLLSANPCASFTLSYTSGSTTVSSTVSVRPITGLAEVG